MAGVLSHKLDQLATIAEAMLQKRSAVDAAMLAGGGAPMDPAMAGMDPAMAGMDPTAMGGGPAAGGGGAPPGPDPLESRLAALEAQLAAGGGAAGGVEPIKPKIDVNVEIMRMNKMIARIADALGVQIPAAEMVATQDDLTQMGMQSQQGGVGGGAGGSAIGPIEPMQGASPALAGGGKSANYDPNGEAYDAKGLFAQAAEADAMFEILSGNG